MDDKGPPLKELEDELERVRSKLHCRLLICRITTLDDRSTVIEIGEESHLSQNDRSRLTKQASSITGLGSGVIELEDDRAAFFVQLQFWTTAAKIILIAVEPQVLPDDLLRADELGSLLPWAALVASDTLSPFDVYAEAIAGLSPRAFLMAVCDIISADSAIIWLLDPGTRKPHMTAKAAWGIRTTIANFDIPVGRGIVGRLTAGSKPTIQLLNERNVYNPAVVFAEAWKACIAVPVIAGGQMIGALSLYTRTRFGTDSLSKLRDNRRVELDCLQFVRRFRKRSMQAERERLIESRLERLQIGVELLGFAHDLAESAERAASRASELRSELPKQLLPPALESTLADLGEDAEVVHQVTRSMNRLVRSQRIERRDFDLHDEITVVEPILIAMTDAVELKIPRGLIVHGDPLDVQRIIINLVSNARYWTSEDNAEVVVTAVKSSIDSSIVDLSVRDNGRGMTEVERRAATDLLYSTRKNGLGLGLFVVKRLTDRLGGELSIASTLHRGTTVTVSLPISERRR